MYLAAEVNSPQPTMSLLSLSRPFLPSFKSNQTSNGNPRFPISSSLHSISLCPFASFSLSKLTSLSNPLSPPLLAAWQPPKYEYPDPIPEFAVAESEKFRGELRKKLARSKETFGDDIDAVVEACAEMMVKEDQIKIEEEELEREEDQETVWKSTCLLTAHKGLSTTLNREATQFEFSIGLQIFSEFLHKEYGGPGTLLVEPFTDMLLALKEKKLPGAPVAARAALLWAQNYLDQDWDLWNSQGQP